MAQAYSFTFAFDSLAAMVLVFMRMGGMIFLNPLFMRRNVPNQVKIVLALALTVLITPGLDAGAASRMASWELVTAMFREFFVGFCCSFVFILFYYLLFFAGDFMDMQFGLSMAKVFDPGTSIQSSASGNLLSVFFMLYIFATDSHLLMLRIFSSSYRLVPLGADNVMTTAIAGFMVTLFISTFSLILRLTLPYVAAEFVVEMAMGVLMKLIPQIHVFVINIQVKLVLCLLMLLVFAPAMGDFISSYLQTLFQMMEKALYTLGGAG